MLYLLRYLPQYTLRYLLRYVPARPLRASRYQTTNVPYSITPAELSAKLITHTRTHGTSGAEFVAFCI